MADDARALAEQAEADDDDNVSNNDLQQIVAK
eukprot:CAMPEP_0198353910 /NCGR_PEP_ID=MMETSP1450-20131203/113310_1 /TAXON_ID=753684 ORGANISM="Madagascaria erythrocladiodes, Strain CCMP3234" /NCGR_SAMPLE_ID=MMETSP1450 /ASSEMBLY_ACC=CAM_ASM_001115 /LENGTH=31 /DNA_ID= /DNA_START= /DNA_END= /DNA_ORIENTATION=